MGLLGEAAEKPLATTDTASSDRALVADVLQIKGLFANNHLSDVLFVFSSDSGGSTSTATPTSSVDNGEESHALLAPGEPSHHLIPAHRLVLSLRSGAFHAALLRAKSSQMPSQVRFPLKIHVQDTPYRVFLALLRFLYTSEIPADGSAGACAAASTRREREREEFWQQLLRAAFVYLVPSLLDICVKEISSFLLSSDTAKDTEQMLEAAESKMATRKTRQLQKKTLDVLVFTDSVLNTNPLTARRTDTRRRTAASNGAIESGMEATIDAEYVDEDSEGSKGLAPCTTAVRGLQALCMKQLEGLTDAPFEALLQSDMGRQCSTERLCEILRRRSDTPLVVAVRYQLGRAVNELLRLGESLDHVGDDETDLPLVAALKTGNDAIVRRLLVDENAPFFLLTDKIPLLFLACASGKVRHCEILIEQTQADVNLISQLQAADKEITAEFGHQQTPLHIASVKGHSAVVELLLRHKAAANLPDDEGNTALHCTANIETVEVLLSSEFKTNANIPNRRGRTPLHMAAARGDVAVVAFLIRHGAQQDIVDDQGQSAFHHAAANGHTAVALILLHENEPGSVKPSPTIETGAGDAAAGTESSSSTSGDGVKPAEEQVNGEEGDDDEQQEEETHGFDINQEDMKGNTALHLAAMSPSERCQKMLQLLLENGADPNRSNWFGYTPLHLFCSHQCGPASVVDVFIEHGANIHAQSLDGSTALHLAVGRASEEVAVALVTAGAFVHLLDAAGRSVVDLVESTNQGAMLVPVLRNLAKPPEWAGDDQVTECSSCHAAFRLAMRKHHCRHCGRILCYNCSSNRLPIPKFHLQKPERVCETCFDVLSFRKLL